EKVLDDWIKRCRGQLDADLWELETFRKPDWPDAGRLMQPEITTACMVGYVRRVEPDALPAGRYSRLDHLSSRCGSHPPFIPIPHSSHARRTIIPSRERARHDPRPSVLAQARF